jgi:hypothetical protein
MINRDDIEAGDKCYTRDGGCLVARVDEDGDVSLGAGYAWDWQNNGKFLRGKCHPLDIVRIVKSPKPVVEEVRVVSHAGMYGIANGPEHFEHAIKLTIINGKMDKWEQVK